jgi:hypothetical protein
LEESGFERVGISLNDPEMPVPSDSMEFERSANGEIDSVTVAFAKYGEPKFQIHFSRREKEPPNSFVRAANLVRGPNRYYDFWGKPWWLPRRFWIDRAAVHVVNRIVPMLAQVLEFLEQGHRGANVGLEA